MSEREFNRLALWVSQKKCSLVRRLLSSLRNIFSGTPCICGRYISTFSLSHRLGNWHLFYISLYQANKNGLPDLTLWNVRSQTVKMIEVKAPGDSLSAKQKLWIKYLNDTIGIPTSVCYVKKKENPKETIQHAPSESELSKVKRNLQFDEGVAE